MACTSLYQQMRPLSGSSSAVRALEGILVALGGHCDGTAPPCATLPMSHTLAMCQSCTFAGVPDPLALLPPPPCRGFFILPPPPEFTEQAGFLHLPFQLTQRQLHIVMMHRDAYHGPPSGAEWHVPRALPSWPSPSAAHPCGHVDTKRRAHLCTTRCASTT